MGGELKVVSIVLVCDGGIGYGTRGCAWNHADPGGETRRADHELTGILVIAVFLI